jgi:S1-C subfamily serine protease
MKFLNKHLLLLAIIIFSVRIFAQDNSTLDATKIAGNYYNSIVKILVFDSLAEKAKPGTGYVGRGSGFLVTEDGYIFTNKHVIDNCISIMGYSYYDPVEKKTLTNKSNYEQKNIIDPEFLSISYISKAAPIIQIFTDKYGSYKLFYAKVVALDTANFDGAILKIMSELDGKPITQSFHPAPLGNSDLTQQGEDLCVYGFPAQYDGGFDVMLRDQSTLTFGKNSGNDYMYNPQYGFIKTDASINGGNSGGPVFDKSNQVIGLASLTIDKTNTGLIGGINAMYDIAALVPGLLEQLKQTGFKAPLKIVNNKTAIVAPNQLFPTAKQLQESNTEKKVKRKFLSGSWYFKGSTSMYQGDKFTVNAAHSDPLWGGAPAGYSTNSSGSLNVKLNRSYGFEIGRLFTLWRIDPKQKLSLDWTILSANYGSTNWSNSNLYKDTAGSVIKYNSKKTAVRIGTRLGLNYSRIFFKQFIADVYYKASIYGELDIADNIHGFNIGDINNNNYGPSNNNAKINYTISHGLITHAFGFNIRYKVFMLGMEYSFGKAQINYNLPYYKYDVYSGYQFNSTGESGYRKVSTLNLTCGLMLGGKNKWKKMRRKEYRQSLKK